MSWIKPKPAHQSILSLILITLGLALLTVFILFLSDYLAVVCIPRIHYLFTCLQLHLLLCCGPYPFPFYHHFCSDVCVDCHDWDQRYHWLAPDVHLHPHTSTIHFCSWWGSITPSLPLLSCTDSHTRRVWCKSKQIRQKCSHPISFFGFQVMLQG